MRVLVVILMLLSSTCCLRGQQAVLRSRQVIITDHANTIDGQMLLLRNISAADRIQSGVDASDQGETNWLSPTDSTNIESGGATIQTSGRAAQITLRTDWNAAGAFSRLLARTYPGAVNTGRGLILGGVVYGGSLATPTASLIGSTAFEFRGGGYDGTAERTDQGSMLIRIPATWSGTSAPTEILFRTTAVSSVSERDVFLLESTGNAALKVGGATFAFPNSLNSDRGFLSGASVSTDGDIEFFGEGITPAFIPQVDAGPNLGLATRRWLNIYGVTGRYQDLLLGTPGSVQGTIAFSNTVNTDEGFLRGAGTSGDGDIEFFGEGVAPAFIPSVDAGPNLGLATKRWLNVYGVTGRFATIRDPTDTVPVEIKTISPLNNGSDTIGTSTTDRFSTVYSGTLILGQPSSVDGAIGFYNAASGTGPRVSLTSANVTTSASDLEVVFASTSGAMYPSDNGVIDFGLATRRWDSGFFERLTLGNNACDISVSTGAPTGACTTCDIRLRSTGGPPNLYVCEASAWVGK